MCQDLESTSPRGVERAERGEKTKRPMEVRREETTMTQEMLRDLERKLSEIEVSVPEKLL